METEDQAGNQAVEAETEDQAVCQTNTVHIHWEMTTRKYLLAIARIKETV